MAKRSVARSFALFAFVYLLQFKLMRYLPIDKLNLPGNLDVYLYRSISVGISLFFIWLFIPQVLKRFRINLRDKTGLIIAVALVYYFVLGFVDHHGQGLSFWQIIDGGIFALFIGLDEEFFDRGFVFRLLERWGTELALFGSALIFGAEHFGNFLYGDESFNYVLGHMVAAGSFGYLMAALMLAFGNIWVPILVHGIVDFPWVLMDPKENAAIVTGNTNWYLIGLELLKNLLIARVLLYVMKKYDGQYGQIPIVKRLGLVE